MHVHHIVMNSVAPDAVQTEYSVSIGRWWVDGGGWGVRGVVSRGPCLRDAEYLLACSTLAQASMFAKARETSHSMSPGVPEATAVHGAEPKNVRIITADSPIPDEAR